MGDGLRLRMLLVVVNVHSPIDICNLFERGSGPLRKCLYEFRLLICGYFLQGYRIVFHIGKFQYGVQIPQWKSLPAFTPSVKNRSSYSSSNSPCRLIKVRIPVMVARSSIRGNSIPRSLRLESSPICSASLFPRHDH